MSKALRGHPYGEATEAPTDERVGKLIGVTYNGEIWSLLYLDERVMGVLTDVFIGSRADAETIDAETLPLDRFPGIDVKGLDTVKFDTLQCILTGEDFDDICSQTDLVVQCSDEGPWVTTFSKTLLDALVELPDDRIPEIAAQWIETEEFQMDRWEIDGVQNVIRRMVETARQAAASGKELFVWMSL